MTILNSLKGMWGGGAVATSPIPEGLQMAVGTRQQNTGFNHTAMVDGGIFNSTEPTDGIDSYRDITSHKAVDALFGSGWLGGLVDAANAQIIGDGLRLNVKPRIELLGWSPEKASEFSKQVEALFAVWSENKREFSFSGTQSFAQYQKAALRSYWGTGDMLAIHPMKKRTGNMFAAKSQLLDVSRLDTSNGQYGTEAQGIFYEGGAAAGIVVTDRDIATGDETWQPKRVPFVSRSGKPLSSLIFDHVTPAQRRGISPLLPVLRLISQMDKLTDASLASAQLQTMLAVAVTSNANSEEILQALSNGDTDNDVLKNWASNKLGFYGGQGAMVGGSGISGNIPVTHLFPGETMDFKSPAEGADNLADFSRLLKMEVCRAMGIPYTISGDYSSATYSSTRMEAATNWPLVLQRRKLIAQLCNDVFQSFLEEIIVRGLVQLPAGIDQFFAMRPAFRAEWRGPSMPQADEGKSAKASQMRLATGTSSLADECAASGSDWQEVLDQRAREKEYAKVLGLSDPHVADPEAPKPNQPESKPVKTPFGAMTFESAIEDLEKSKARLAGTKLMKSGPKDTAATVKVRQQTYTADFKQLTQHIASMEAAIETAQTK